MDAYTIKENSSSITETILGPIQTNLGILHFKNLEFANFGKVDFLQNF